jgi:hypothetical protein
VNQGCEDSNTESEPGLQEGVYNRQIGLAESL